MRAAMKLATGVVPVALGVAMALVSGMTNAEEKVTPPLSGAVSAQTTLPSVGHRPQPANDATYVFLRGPEVSSENPPKSDSLGVSDGDVDSYEGILMSGQSFYRIMLSGGGDVDDKQFGASDGYKDTCKVYRVYNDGNEELISESQCPVSNKPQPGAEYILTDEDVGYRIRFVYYGESDPKTTGEKYKPTPDKSLKGFSFITTRIAPKYRINDWATTISDHTLQINSGKKIRYDVYANDIKGKPLSGYVGENGQPSIFAHAVKDDKTSSLDASFLGEFTPGIYSYEIKARSNTQPGTYNVFHKTFLNESSSVTKINVIF